MAMLRRSSLIAACAACSAPWAAPPWVLALSSGAWLGLGSGLGLELKFGLGLGLG